MSAWCFQCWSDACLLVRLPDLLDSSVGDALDQRYLACTPPPQLLLDDPTYLPLVQLDHKPPKVGSEIISGNETNLKRNAMVKYTMVPGTEQV